MLDDCSRPAKYRIPLSGATCSHPTFSSCQNLRALFHCFSPRNAQHRFADDGCQESRISPKSLQLITFFHSRTWIMMKKNSLRFLTSLGGNRTTLRAATRPVVLQQVLPQSRPSSSLPTIAQPSFWAALIPKPFRKSAKSEGNATTKEKSKEWNPATFFIVIFILIGSMSINMITMRNDFAAFTRKSDVRIGLLREVIERIQRGEKVDVEKALGTGDPNREQEWEDREHPPPKSLLPVVLSIETDFFFRST
jgi:hypothetical protein